VLGDASALNNMLHNAQGLQKYVDIIMECL